MSILSSATCAVLFYHRIKIICYIKTHQCHHLEDIQYDNHEGVGFRRPTFYVVDSVGIDVDKLISCVRERLAKEGESHVFGSVCVPMLRLIRLGKAWQSYPPRHRVCKSTPEKVTHSLGREQFSRLNHSTLHRTTDTQGAHAFCQTLK